MYVVVSSTSFNESYNFLPDAHVFTHYDPKIVEDLLDKQHKLVERGVTRHVCLVLDDVLGSVDLRKPQANPELQRLWSSNRHYKISVLIATQSPKGLPPIIRQNADFASFHKSLMSAMQTLWEDYGDRSKQEWVDFLMGGTRDYQFLLWSAREPDPDKKISAIKIPPTFLNFAFKLKCASNCDCKRELKSLPAQSKPQSVFSIFGE